MRVINTVVFPICLRAKSRFQMKMKVTLVVLALLVALLVVTGCGSKPTNKQMTNAVKLFQSFPEPTQKALLGLPLENRSVYVADSNQGSSIVAEQLNRLGGAKIGGPNADYKVYCDMKTSSVIVKCKAGSTYSRICADIYEAKRFGLWITDCFATANAAETVKNAKTPQVAKK